jgi:hypothetical protein
MTSRILTPFFGYHDFGPYRKSIISPLPIVALALVFCLLPLSKSDSEVIEIPLPELTGSYNIDTLSRTVAFDLGQCLAEIHQVWIRWAGTSTYGTGHGDGVERPVEPWFDWPGSLSATMDTDEPGYWHAISQPAEGAFEDTALFRPISDVTWEFLLDGAGEVEFYFELGTFLGGVMVVPPSLELDSVFPILDATLATGVGNTSTWGEIKSLYRRNSASP